MTIVWAWMAINGFGLAFAVWDLWEASLDMRVLQAWGVDDARADYARGDVRSQAVRVVVLLLFIVAGLVSLAGVYVDSVRWLLLAGAALISADAVADRRTRRRVMDGIDRRQE